MPVFACFHLLFLSFDKEGMLNHPIPLLPNKTLDGKVIDEYYYKGHVTIVSFMYIGCLPCMDEINTLNKIYDEYSSNKQLQVLCVARQMREQMVAFNGNNKTIFSKIRNAWGVDPIKYSIQPACNDSISMIEKNTDDTMTLKSECATIEINTVLPHTLQFFMLIKKE